MEALDLAVGAWPVGLSGEVADAPAAAGGSRARARRRRPASRGWRRLRDLARARSRRPLDHSRATGSVGTRQRCRTSVPIMARRDGSRRRKRPRPNLGRSRSRRHVRADPLLSGRPTTQLHTGGPLARPRDPEGVSERRLGDVTVSEGRIELALRSQPRVRVTVYRLTRLYRTRTEQLLDERLAPGTHRVDLTPRSARAKEAFVVVRADEDEVQVAAVRR